MYNENFAQQGWQCPICKRVYSPATFMCYYCGDNSVTVTSTGTGSIPMPVDPSTTGGIPKPDYKITISDATTALS
jgi:hypothetical protein